MAMSRKHYVAIAREFAQVKNADWGDVVPTAEDMREACAARVADVMAKDNPNFDRARFLYACKVA